MTPISYCLYNCKMISANSVAKIGLQNAFKVSKKLFVNNFKLKFFKSNKRGWFLERNETEQSDNLI